MGKKLPVASPPSLSPIKEDINSTPSPLVPNAWKCCNCNILIYFFDDNQAWYTHTPEYCTSLSCLHERCPTCFDPGPILWPIQYAENRPIPHLFEELQASFTRQEEEEATATATTTTLMASGEGSFLSDSEDSTSETTNINNVNNETLDEEEEESVVSDEDHWLEILGHTDPPRHPSRPPPLRPQLCELNSDSLVGVGAGRVVSYPCPLRTTRFCEERFETEALAWRHSAVHTGQERVKCARRGCPMVFLGKKSMRLHFLGRHC